MLFGRGGTLPRLAPSWDKASLSLDEYGGGHADSAAPLRALILLGARECAVDVPRMSVIAGPEGFLGVVANSYVNYLLDPRMRAVEFAQVSRLVNRYPVRRVIPSTNPSRLGALVTTIVDAVRAE